MRIALVRHGQTDWNITWRLQGHADNDLNDTGREQARVAASLLADQHWDLAVSSTLKRAIETADIIANILEVPRGEHDPMLVERAYGEAEGLTKEEAVEKFGTDWPGQEAYEDLEARAVAGIDGVARRHPGKDLIIVAHGTFIRAFADATTGLETLTPSNAHSLRIEGEPGNWTITEGLLLQQ